MSAASAWYAVWIWEKVSLFPRFRLTAAWTKSYAMVRQWTIQAPITQPLTHRAADADAAGRRALCMHYCDHEPPQQASWRLVAHRNNKKLSLFYGVQTVNGCQRRNTQLTTHAYGCWRAAVSVHDRPLSVAACAELVGRVREPCSPRLIEALNDN